ncbi:flagellar transcriptional regulator FlhD [Paraburkholderia sabiae]|jgi:flagellar transcriptional activator FlhD|uniref:Flagellar transcriptional regulator FlhD n=1 Tax=Paraburkholderia sabiae TaxID=273251 RepID=A0ABU9Q914_9BURK|nr:flagellar transcriptional regulator FlhD [Paraburkholderia sabiae]WJZ78460.1 flagellar transcriptional regulator FlhD [Paraburkholderia sabiae]CAD6508835.1 Flagellar transcriptional regulator FlhD [Paraburkholderia sabiae]CAG9205664.1 DNA-binding transcriptional dual regulator FlhD [Paraburkholderia sabiae]
MQTSSEVLNSIHEINLSYLILAQKILREDRSVAMFRLGVSAELATILADFTVAQITRLAMTDQLLCAFRFSGHEQLAALARPARHEDVKATHAAILLAGQSVEQFA